MNLQTLSCTLASIVVSFSGGQALPRADEFVLSQEMRYLAWANSFDGELAGSLENALRAEYESAFNYALIASVVHKQSETLVNYLEEAKSSDESERSMLIEMALESIESSNLEPFQTDDAFPMANESGLIPNLEFVFKIRLIREGNDDVSFSRSLSENESLVFDLARVDEELSVKRLIDQLRDAKSFGSSEEKAISALRTYQGEAKIQMLELLSRSDLAEITAWGPRELLVHALNEHRLRGDVDVFEALIDLRERSLSDDRLEHLVPRLNSALKEYDRMLGQEQPKVEQGSKASGVVASERANPDSNHESQITPAKAINNESTPTDSNSRIYLTAGIAISVLGILVYRRFRS